VWRALDDDGQLHPQRRAVGAEVNREPRGVHPGRAAQADSFKPSFLELNATRMIDLDRAIDVLSNSRAVQVDSITTRVVSAYGVCNQRL